jgi:hypothetical protein
MQLFYIFGNCHAAVRKISKATKFRKKSKFLLKMGPFNTDLDLKLAGSFFLSSF